MNYITPSGNYYQGDRAHHNAVERAQRPALYSTANQLKLAAVTTTYKAL